MSDSKPYWEKLKDPRWQKKRLDILNRDEFACLDCGDTESTLHVHHCLYRRGLEPWEYEDRELRTLCESCHELRADIEHDVKLEFARLLALMKKDDISAIMPGLLNMQDFGGPGSGICICENDFIGELKRRANEKVH